MSDPASSRIVVGVEDLFEVHCVQAEQDRNRRVVRLCLGEKFLVLIHDAGDSGRRLQAFTRIPLKVQQRPFTCFQTFRPAIEEPEDDAVGTGADARPGPRGMS